MSQAGHAGYASRILRAAARQPSAGNEAQVPAPAVDPVQAEADQIVSAAEMRARSILNQAFLESERIREASTLAAEEERKAMLAGELLRFSRRLRKEFDDIRPQLARMVVEAVEAIIGTFPEDEVAERMIRRGLRDLDAQTRVSLHCAREDRTVLASIVERMREAGEDAISTVEADPDLQSGICRLEAAGISVELGIRAQLDLLEELLLREEQLAAGGARSRHETMAAVEGDEAVEFEMPSAPPSDTP